MLDLIQQIVSGVALGCVYGLIALGFVLIPLAISFLAVGAARPLQRPGG